MTEGAADAVGAGPTADVTTTATTVAVAARKTACLKVTGSLAVRGSLNRGEPARREGAGRARRLDLLQHVEDVVLQRLGLGTEHRLHAVADLDHPGRAERFEPGLVHLGLVGDVHPQPGDAGVDVD